MLAASTRVENHDFMHIRILQHRTENVIFCAEDNKRASKNNILHK
jgi:hypothetical protein